MDDGLRGPQPLSMAAADSVPGEIGQGVAMGLGWRPSLGTADLVAIGCVRDRKLASPGVGAASQH